MPTTKRDPRRSNGTRRNKLRKRVAELGLPCHLCGRPIDYTLTTWTDPKDGRVKRHPMSFELDEIVPVSKGGDPYDFDNVAPAHRICNQMKGNRLGFTLAAPGVPYGQANEDYSSGSPAPSGSGGPSMFVDSEEWT